MRSLLRAIALVPVWFLTLLLKPLLPANHPWRKDSLTLRSWCQKGTVDAIQFGVIFWILGLCQSAMIYLLCQK